MTRRSCTSCCRRSRGRRSRSARTAGSRRRRKSDGRTSLVHIPDDDLAGLAAAGGAVAFAVEGNAIQFAGAPVERLLVDASRGVPVVHLAVAVGAGEEPARRVEGDGEEVRLAELVVG